MNTIHTNDFQNADELREWLKTNRLQVFLGGAANPTTWRFDTAIPLFESNGIVSFNPQVSGWQDEFLAIEELAKDSTECLLFVVNEQTRAVATLVEIVEHLYDTRPVFIMIGDVADVSNFKDSYAKDNDRGRKFLRSLASRYGVPTYESISEAAPAANTTVIPGKNPSIEVLVRTADDIMNNRIDVLVLPPAEPVELYMDDEVQLLNQARQYVRNLAQDLSRQESYSVYTGNSIQEVLSAVVSYFRR